MNNLINWINDEIQELKDDSCSTMITFNRHELRMIRDALIMNDAIIETSFKILDYHIEKK